MPGRAATVPAATLKFFRELKRNNRKEWMDANRERYRAEVVELRQSVAAMLEGGDCPDAPFDDFAAFDGVAPHRNRHLCVLLPFDAVLAAFEAWDREDRDREP